MKILISLLLSYMITKIIFKIAKIIQNKVNYETIEYIDNELLINMNKFFYVKTFFVDIKEIRNIEIRNLKISLINFGKYNIKSLSIKFLVNNKNHIILNKNNSLVILKLLKKYNEYIFDQVFKNNIFNIYGLEKSLKEELEKINV